MHVPEHCRVSSLYKVSREMRKACVRPTGQVRGRHFSQALTKCTDLLAVRLHGFGILDKGLLVLLNLLCNSKKLVDLFLAEFFLLFLLEVQRSLGSFKASAICLDASDGSNLSDRQRRREVVLTETTCPRYRHTSASRDCWLIKAISRLSRAIAS